MLGTYEKYNKKQKKKMIKMDIKCSKTVKIKMTSLNGLKIWKFRYEYNIKEFSLPYNRAAFIIQMIHKT